MKAGLIVRIALLVVLLALLAAGGGFLWILRSGRPIREGKVSLFELGGPVTVRFDEWAVPHVQAGNARDLAMAIGWLHANERMTQMELGRRAAFGRLAELLGEKALPLDRAALELRLGETATAMVEKLTVEHRGLLEAYALGVNSWLERHPHGLPPELVALRREVRPWQVSDSLAFLTLLSRDLSYPMRFEEQRLQWLLRAGLQRLRDVSDVGLELDPELEHLLARPAGTSPTGEPVDPDEGTKNGSNSWAVGRSRTKSEAPLVANDPHLDIGAPSLWYQATLRSPEYEAMGMTLPGLPLVVIGQNANVAWSFTNTELDTSDLFVEELSADGASVRRGERFVELVRERVEIPVRGESPAVLDLWRSDLGPFFPADPARGLPARSLVWSGHIAFDPLTAFMALARARSVGELPAACASFVCPVQNLIVADRMGGLLFTLLGRVPDRAAGDGRLPLPAWDAAKHWRGLRAADTNPRVLLPHDDMLASANNDVRPKGYPHSLPADFDMEFRLLRVRERVGAHDAWWPSDLSEVQADTTSLHARRVVSLLPQEVEGEAAFARRTLAAWDANMSLIGPSALYALFERELFRAVYADELEHYGLSAIPGLSRGGALLAALDGTLPETWLDDVSSSGHVETLAEVVQTALTRAWREGNQRFGRDVTTWDYGSMHTWTARHPLDALPFGKRILDRGPFPVPGSATTIAAFSGRWREGRIEVTHGPSMRWVGDCGDPDRSLCVLPTGQSGHPSDEHYDDQTPVFLQGRTHAMHWSEASIASATVSTLLLEP